jgi:Divergent InlB B-repeat domain
VRRFIVALLVLAALSAAAATAAKASTWCGSAATADRLPQTVSGPSVHFVYAYPSDGVDRLATFGTTMQTDAETIDAWWRGQDPTRTPRFDLFAFPCGAQLDISDVKLANTTAELTPVDGRFQKIVASVAAATLAAPYQIEVIYYDAPPDDQQVCGQGGTNDPLRGPAFAVVYTESCPGEPTSVVAAHEMTHAFGAVIPPAPHDCPPPNDFHVCDSNRDLMFPSGNGTPLSDLVLDVGRDDYYGAPGVGFDVRTSRWLRHLDEPVAHLALALKGPGTVESDSPGVDCTAACASDWDGGQTVTLTATPAAGARFVRWDGACTGLISDCTLTLSGDVSVSALFAPESYLLSIGVTGHGGVATSASQLVCRKRCKLAVPSYESVSLRAVAQKGWRFKRWAGSCRGTSLRCALPMTASVGAVAIFTKRP